MHSWTKTQRCCFLIAIFCSVLLGGSAGSGQAQEDDKGNRYLPGTEPLKMEGDIASDLVAGADRFLLQKIEVAGQDRAKFWNALKNDLPNYDRGIEKLRTELVQLLGVRDALAKDTTPYMLTSADRSSVVGLGEGFEIHRIQWHTFGDCYGRGLMLVPVEKNGTKRKPRGQIIAIPDCEVSPEQLSGLVPGVKPNSQYARILAENGFQVVVPVLVDRSERMPKLSNREWLYRSAFELGRGMIAYEIQELQALIRWMATRKAEAGKIGLIGWGEGGLLSLYTSAIDKNVDATAVSGYFHCGKNRSIAMFSDCCSILMTPNCSRSLLHAMQRSRQRWDP
jgi:hypothetical protein